MECLPSGPALGGQLGPLGGGGQGGVVGLAGEEGGHVDGLTLATVSLDLLAGQLTLELVVPS